MQAFGVQSQNLLFHYTSRDAALGSILPSGRFKYSSFETMRDPYESKGWELAAGVNIDPVRDPDGEAANRRYWEVRAIADDVKRQARLAAFSLSGDAGTDALSKAWARASMWEHYGESHRGVCLVFDREKLVSATLESLEAVGLPKPYYKPVIYQLEHRSNPVFNISREVIQMDHDELRRFVFRFVEKNNESFFYRKAGDWSNELEYRFVVTVPDGFVSDVFVDIQDALIAIVAGEQFPDWAVPGALELARSADIRAKQVQWLGDHTFLADLKPPIGWEG